MDDNEKIGASLQWPDYVVVAVVLLVSTSIGIYYRFSGGRQKTSAEYFSANNTMSVPLLAITMMVAVLSAISMLGMSSENYVYGVQFIVWTFGQMLVMPLVAFLYLPVFYRLQNLSVYEYLERRFGVAARLTASIAHYVQISLYTGVTLYAPALALEATTGLSSALSLLLIGLVCTFYSTVGGIKAIAATDVFQGSLMFATIFCVIVFGCHDLEGGISEVWRLADEGGRLNLFNFDLDPTVRHTWWSLMIGGGGIFISTFGVNQVYVQRLLSARSLKSAQIALFLTTVLSATLILLTSLSGLVLYAWFEGCDPVASGDISSFDQVLPYFAKVRLSQIPGLLGFVVAGLFSACLSSVSALLNSQSAVALGDYVKPLYRKFGRELPDSKATLFGKILCVVNGLMCVGIAFLAARLGSLLQTALAINGAIGGPLVGLFSLGIFVEGANEKGAVTGTILSFILSGCVNFGSKPPAPELPVSIDRCTNTSYPDPTTSYMHLVDSRKADDSGDYFYLNRLSYLWNNPMGIATTMLFGYIASIVVRCCSTTPIAQPDPDLFTPMLASRMRRRRRNLARIATSQTLVLDTKDLAAGQ